MHFTTVLKKSIFIFILAFFLFNANNVEADTLLDVPVLGQHDTQWVNYPLGTCPSTTIGSHGCAITALSMLFQYYGASFVDPVYLNDFLLGNGGYADGCLVDWQVAAWATVPEVEIIWQGSFDFSSIPADLELIKGELDSGRPVIAEVRLFDSQHFVLITGYSGNTFFINDPWYGDISTINSRYHPDPAIGIYGVRLYTGPIPVTTGFGKISTGVTVSPSTVILGQDFTVDFTLTETLGAPVIYEQIVVAILDADGNHLFDIPESFSNITLSANSSWNGSVTGKILKTLPVGEYQAVVRGRVSGGNWFDFETTGPVGLAVNPTTFLSENPAPSIAIGYAHVTLIDNDGSRWAWGSDSEGQLGNGTSGSTLLPAQMDAENGWQSTSAAYWSTFAIKSDGSLWAWGNNNYGQLGDGTTVNRSSPVQIGNDTDWEVVSTGGEHALALKADGTLWSWGRNLWGELGDGTSINRSSPVQIGNDYDWKMVSAGGSYSLALKADGTLWGWGSNSYGQLGFGGANVYSPTKFGTDSDWKQISAGYAHTLAIKNNGTLWAWGYNAYGQLGNGTTTSTSVPQQVASSDVWLTADGGYNYSTAINADGSLWSWGQNNYGQLGNGSNSDSYVPAYVGSQWQKVRAGNYTSVGLKDDGSVWTWGANWSGQLGDGTNATSYSPIQVFITFSDIDSDGVADNEDAFPTDPAASLDSDGDGYPDSWNDGFSQADSTTGLALDALPFDNIEWVDSDNDGIGDNSDDFPFVPVDRTIRAKVGGGAFYSAYVSDDGSLWSWGQNHGAPDGYRVFNYVPEMVGTDFDWSHISVGVTHALVIKSDGTLWAWGLNTSGQLGDGTYTNRLTPVQIGTDNDWLQASAGGSHSLGLKTNGTLWAWGLNTSGRFGDGTTTSKNFPVFWFSVNWRIHPFELVYNNGGIHHAQKTKKLHRPGEGLHSQTAPG